MAPGQIDEGAGIAVPGRPTAVRIGSAEAITPGGSPLGRILETLSEFTVLTGYLRAAAEPRLAPRLHVTGWRDGILKVHLDEPALLTRWRFLAPGIGRALAQRPGLAGLREIRVTADDVHLGTRSRRVPEESALSYAPVESLQELAADESHPKLRQALLSLAAAAARARAAKGS